MKILFFIDSLNSGGKERRLLELIQYLKQFNDYTIALVLTENNIYYEYVYELGIPIKIIKRKGLKYDPRLFIKFYMYCSYFKPDIIHSWGRMATFYSIPAKLIHHIPLISSIIADVLGNYKTFSLRYFFLRADILFSNIILSNSKAGLAAYKINNAKTKVICNGVHLERFQQKYDTKIVRKDLGITTDYMLVMVATFSKLKDYDLFLDVAIELGKIRSDVTFVGVGDGPEWRRIWQRVKNEQINNVILTGKQRNVEQIIASSDLGILCTYSEGISNSIIECMAFGKPVISTDIIGGSKEIILEGETGYCIERNAEKIVTSINFLLNNPEIRTSMGNIGKERIRSHFSIKRMGEEFKILYNEILAESKNKKVKN
jgi:glycosyltransferase involved in cell wall biosynthesis